MTRGRERDANAGEGRGEAPANPELQAAVAAEFERLMPGMLQTLVSSILDELEAVVSTGRGGGRGQPAIEVGDEAEAEKSVGECKKGSSSASTWKRSGDQTWTASAKKAKVEDKKSKPEPKQIPSCLQCGRAHRSECKFGSSGCYKCGRPGHLAKTCKVPITCFNCGQPGHVARVCLKERKVVASSSKTDGRVLTITKEQAEQDPDVVSGTFPINGFTASVLFDSGASRSFISLSFAKLAGLRCSVVPETFSVSTAGDKSVVIRSRLKEGRVELEGCVFTATLYVISLGEFDVVLGMDWLSAHDAQINCKSRSVRLKSRVGREVVVFGDRVASGVKVISMMKAERLLARGCYAYLAHVVDAEAKTKSVADVAVVRDFPDVFLRIFLESHPKGKLSSRSS